MWKKYFMEVAERCFSALSEEEKASMVKIMYAYMRRAEKRAELESAS